jgi:hypothetical protein
MKATTSNLTDDRYDFDDEPLTEEEREAEREAVEAMNAEEGRNHPDIGKAKWEAGLPEYRESEIEW